MTQINPRPGKCVCIARADGYIVRDTPQAYNALAQGDSPAWHELVQRAARADSRPVKRRERKP